MGVGLIGTLGMAVVKSLIYAEMARPSRSRLRSVYHQESSKTIASPALDPLADVIGEGQSFLK